MNKWVSLTKPTKAYRLEKYRMAASLDGVLEVHGGAIPFEDPQTGEVVMLEGKGCCEIKTQGYNDGPPTYENILQVQAQMLCSGFKWAIIGKLGPRLKFEMFVFKGDADLQNTIIEYVQDFWNKVDNNLAYDDDQEPEKSFVDWTEHKTANKLTDLVNNHEYAIEQIKEWTDKKNVMRDSIISMLQSENVKYVTINNKKVAVDTVIRKATPEKVVAAKPETSHTKLTIKEMKDE